MSLRRFGPILLGLGAVACGASVSRQLALPPVTAEAGSGSRPGDGARKLPGAEQERKTPEPPLNLEEFRPILASAHLASIRQKMEEQRYVEAAEELSAWMTRERPVGIERARFSFLLGSLLRLAGDNASAADALSPAAETDWILREDARLLLAEIWVSLERWLDVERVAEGVPDDVDLGRKLSVLASAQVGLGRDAAALPLLVRLSDVRPEAQGRLRLAQCLLRLAAAAAPTSPGGAASPPASEHAADADDFEVQALATRALREARLSALGLSESSELARKAREVQHAARRLGAVEEDGSELALIHAEKLIDARLWEEAEQVVLTIPSKTPRVWDADQCRLEYLKAKILAGQREWGAGADRLQGAAEHCGADAEVHAKILFNAGKFAAADSRNTAAAGYYERLETLYPMSSLADDSRVRRARAYLDAGVVSRFTELLLSLPRDYPDGDLTMEGVLDLALYRIERSDWAGASLVLERGIRAIGSRDSARGHEESGRERYFWARSLGETGKVEAALEEYEWIVRQLPLSYYMLHAYSRLRRAAPLRAEKALEEGLRRAEQEPFSFPHRPEYDSPRFQRGMELLRVGELDQGRSVLAGVGLGPSVDDSLLWGLALLYDRAGDAQVSHRIARGRLTDWLSHYPQGDWLRPWEIGFPRPYHDIVQQESQKTSVPEWFIYGVMREESTFDPQVVSHADAYGLMQLIIPTARAFAKKEGLPATPAALKRPSVNIALGSRVLQSLSDRFRDNPWLAIPGYNAGPGRPARWMRERSDVDFDVWVELIPFRETRRYTKRVLASRAAYAFVYYRQEAESALLLPERLEAR